MLYLRRRILALAASTLVAGCAGSRAVPQAEGNPSASYPTPSQTKSSMSANRVIANGAGSGKLIFRLTIPTLGGGTGGESYVSPATKGMLMALTGPTNIDEAFPLGSGAQGCKATRAGKVTCTVSIAGLKAGAYTALVGLYDQAPNPPNPFPSGNLLSTVPNAPFTISAKHVTQFAPTLAGFPASIAVEGLPTSCATFGPTAFTVAVSDADGNTIAGAYSTAIALSNSDQSGNTMLATSGPDNPPTDQLLSSLDTATIAWNGTPVGTVTIAAQAGSASGSGMFGAGVQPSSQTFAYIASVQTFAVPLCVTSVYVVATGASGAGDDPSVGGTAAGTIPTTPGETLTVYVGGAGLQAQGGFNGGGSGGPSGSNAGGGGATDVRQGGAGLPNRVIVAGGGGGWGSFINFPTYGAGGGLSGTAGIGFSSPSCPGSGGGGGTQTTGGTGGGSEPSADGRFGVGGPGGSGSCGSGGGGGGWYGGGGGANGAGGGGSGYVEPNASNTSLTTGTASAGNGSMTICYGYANGQCSGSALRKFARTERTAKPPRH